MDRVVVSLFAQQHKRFELRLAIRLTVLSFNGWIGFQLVTIRWTMVGRYLHLERSQCFQWLNRFFFFLSKRQTVAHFDSIGCIKLCYHVRLHCALCSLCTIICCSLYRYGVVQVQMYQVKSSEKSWKKAMLTFISTSNGRMFSFDLKYIFISNNVTSHGMGQLTN